MNQPERHWLDEGRHGPTPAEMAAALTEQRGPNPPPEMVATFDALAAEARKIQAQRAAAIRAEAFREAAAELDAQTCQCGCRRASNFLRTLADAAAPPSGPAAPPQHIGTGANAEDCPACAGTNPPYPFLCPGPTEKRTPCSQPNPCEDGELCATHEEEQAHAEGEHAFCGPTCEVEFPSDKLRNTILYRALPGSARMLDELLRRAAAAQREEG